jgi:hypothetical protein
VIAPTRALAVLAQPMVLLDRRQPWLEAALELPLTGSDIASIREACATSGRRLGHY